MTNPCKASTQLTRSVTRWAEQWSMPCGDRAGRDPKFFNKIQAWMDKLAGSVQKRARCDEMDEGSGDE